jgi:hypothetical protein
MTARNGFKDRPLLGLRLDLQRRERRRNKNRKDRNRKTKD